MEDKKSYIKSVEFDEGLGLTYLRTEVFTPNKGANGEDFGAKHKYGAGGVIEKENWLIKEGKLKEGESFRYIFKDGDMERHFDNASIGFWIAMNNIKPEENRILQIKRIKGKTNFDITWEIK